MARSTNAQSIIFKNLIEETLKDFLTLLNTKIAQQDKKDRKMCQYLKRSTEKCSKSKLLN